MNEYIGKNSVDILMQPSVSDLSLQIELYFLKRDLQQLGLGLGQSFRVVDRARNLSAIP